MYDVAIIGSGVTGALTARCLSRYNLKICVLEKNNDVAMGATMANSGIVHAGFDALEGSLKAKLNVEGSKMMPQIARELGVEYKNNGALVVAFNDDEYKTLEALLARGNENGVDGLRIIGIDEIKAIEPNISDNVTAALYAPTSSIISPYSLAIAAIGNAMDNGADLKTNFEVKSITFDNDIYTIKSDDDSITARYVVNSAGLFSDSIAQMAGDNSFSVHPRKGEYILLDKDCSSLVNTTVFSTPSEMGKGILVTPTAHGNVLLGPTSTDIDDKNTRDTSVEGFDSIIAQAKARIKNIPFNKTITSFCGVRSVGDTGDFIININKPHFVNAAGIESPGLSASPAIAEYILGLLRDDGLALDENKNYNPTRKPMDYFKRLSNSEKNEVIKNNPSFGRIICRCETVTMGEIIEALNTNPKPCDLDGIKRRTRSGMGRCQGGFCSPLIIDIISRELNIPCEDITKFGGKSKLITGHTKEAADYAKR